MTTETRDTNAILNEMQSQIARLAAENADLKARVDAGADASEESLQRAIREFDQQNRVAVPGAKMQGPCQIPRGEMVCGRPWHDHLSDGMRPAPITDHKYRETALPPSKGRKQGFYRSDDTPVAPDVNEDAYMTFTQAAEALGASEGELRALVEAGTVPVDKIGTVTLVRKRAVDRILELAAIEADNPEAS